MWEERLSVPCLKVNAGEEAGPSYTAPTAILEHKVEREIQSPALLSTGLPCGTCGYVC